MPEDKHGGIHLAWRCELFNVKIIIAKPKKWKVVKGLRQTFTSSNDM